MLSIIIPAYNEQRRIGPTLKRFTAYFSKNRPGDFEIIVVMDGCLDRTRGIVKAYEPKGVRCFEFKSRLGKGRAIAIGVRQAKGDLITYMDADGSTAPEQIDLLVKVLETAGCDGVIASRYLGGSKMAVKQPFMRRLASRVFNLLVRALFGFGFRDTQCGAKVFTRKVAKDIVKELAITDWAFDINLLYNAKKRGYDIREHPIEWTDRADSKFSLFRVAPRMLLAVIRLRMLESPLRGLVKSWPAKRFARGLK